MEDNYLFYNEYEEFYKMSKTSKAFEKFCKKAVIGDIEYEDRPCCNVC